MSTKGNGRPKAAAESSCGAGDDTPKSTRPRPFADAALDLAEVGWLVFPLRTCGKEPLIAKAMGGNGFRDGTVDPVRVAGWARAYPTANVGTRIPESLTLIDVDPRNGGDVSLAELEAEHGPLPPTLTVWSGRGDGGHHLYFEAPGFTATATRLTGTGIDLKTHESGYAVLPPSIHPEGAQAPYRWGEPMCAPVRLPEWLAGLLRPAKPKPRPAGEWKPFRSSPGSLPSVEFDRSSSWADVLEPAGWCHVKDGRWRRPGKDEGTSAEIVTAKDGTELLKVWSSNCGPLIAGRYYSKFAAWAELAHRGDWKAAAAALERGNRR